MDWDEWQGEDLEVVPIQENTKKKKNKKKKDDEDDLQDPDFIVINLNCK